MDGLNPKLQATDIRQLFYVRCKNTFFFSLFFNLNRIVDSPTLFSVVTPLILDPGTESSL